jgi:hypothetical protein
MQAISQFITLPSLYYHVGIQINISETKIQTCKSGMLTLTYNSSYLEG